MSKNNEHQRSDLQYKQRIQSQLVRWTRGFLAAFFRHGEVVLEQFDGHQQTLSFLLQLHQLVGLLSETLDHIFILHPKLFQLLSTAKRPRPVAARSDRLFIRFRQPPRPLDRESVHLSDLLQLSTEFVVLVLEIGKSRDGVDGHRKQRACAVGTTPEVGMSGNAGTDKTGSKVQRQRQERRRRRRTVSTFYKNIPALDYTVSQKKYERYYGPGRECTQQL